MLLITILMIPKWPMWDVMKSLDQTHKDTKMLIDAFHDLGYKCILPVPRGVEHGAHGLADKAELVEMDIDLPDWKEEVMLTKEWYQLFNQFDGKYFYDVVVSEKIQPIAMVKKILAFTPETRNMYRTVPVPVVIGALPWIALEGYGSTLMLMPHDSDVVKWSLFYADKTVLGSPWEVSITLEALRKIFTPSVLKDVMKKITWGRGFDLEGFKEKTKHIDKEKSDKPIVMTAGRPIVAKRFSDIATMFNKLMLLEPNVRCIINSQEKTSPEIKKLSQFYEGELYLGQGFEPYLQRLKSADIFVVGSKTEGFCWTMFEAIVSGCVVVVIDEDWHKGLLPDDYPFVYGNFEQMLSGIRLILEDVEGAKSKIDIDKVIEHACGWEPYKNKWKGIFKEVFSSHQERFFEKASPGSLIGLSSQVLDGTEDFEGAKKKIASESSAGAAPHDFAVYSALQYARGVYSK